MENILSNSVAYKIKNSTNIIALSLKFTFMGNKIRSFNQTNNWIETCIRFNTLNFIANYVVLNILILMVYTIDFSYHGLMCVFALALLVIYKGVNTTLCNEVCNIFRRDEFRIETIKSALLCCITFVYIIICRQFTYGLRDYILVSYMGHTIFMIYDLHIRVNNNRSILRLYNFEITGHICGRLTFYSIGNEVSEVSLKNNFIVIRMSCVNNVMIPKIYIYSNELNLVNKYILNPGCDIVICIGKTDVINSIKYGDISIDCNNIADYI